MSHFLVFLGMCLAQVHDITCLVAAESIHTLPNIHFARTEEIQLLFR